MVWILEGRGFRLGLGGLGLGGLGLGGLVIGLLVWGAAFALSPDPAVADLSEVDFAAGQSVDLGARVWDVWPDRMLTPEDLANADGADAQGSAPDPKVAPPRRARLDQAWSVVVEDGWLTPHRGMMTLRLRVRVPDPAPRLVFGAGFAVPTRLFIDGVERGSNGRPGPAASEETETVRARVPLGAGPEHEIVLQMSYHQRGTAPDFLSRPVIAAESVYVDRDLWVAQVSLALAAVLLVIGLIALMVGLKADGSGPFLWLTTLTWLGAIRYLVTAIAHFLVVREGFAGLLPFGPQPIFIPLAAIGQAATVMVIAKLFPEDLTRPGRGLLIGLALSRPLLWFAYPNLSLLVFDWQTRDIGRLDRDYNVIVILFWALFFAWLGRICWRHHRRGGRHGRLTLVTLSAALAATIYENVTEVVYFSTSSSMLLELVTGLVVMYVLVDRFADARGRAVSLARDLQRINQSLEATVDQRTRTLKQALERQAATSEILAAISTSPGDLTPAFDTIMEEATRLCDARNGTVWLLENGAFIDVARKLGHGEGRRAPFTPSPLTPAGRVLAGEDVVHIPDLAVDPSYLARDPITVPGVERLGIRTCLWLSLRSRGERVGAISIYRTHVEPFSADQIDLLGSFAAQAGIAIENARLFLDLNTRTRELEQNLVALRETQSQLVRAEKMASLGTLVAGVAHEINTPLGIAVTATSQAVLEQDALKRAVAAGQLSRAKLDDHLAAIARGLAIAHANLTRAADLVSSFKRVAVDQNSEDPREIDLAHYVADVVRSLEPILRSARIVVERDIPEGLTATLPPGALAQIITNLVQNAAHHAFADQEDRRIILRAARDAEGGITLTIADNGQGMSEDVRARAFDPFFTTARGRGGTGLGLHIVHNLVVDALGGAISLSASPGAGATFVIRLAGG